MRRILAALIAVSALACATRGIGIDTARRTYAEAKERAGANPDDKDAQKAFVRFTAALANALADEGDLLARRAERLLAMGRKARDDGERDAALDAFMEALFCLGPARLPEDAATLLRERTQIDDLKRIVSGPP